MKKLDHLDTIISPNVTEKSTSLSEYNKIVFKVHKGASEFAENSVKAGLIKTVPRFLIEFLLVLFIVVLVIGTVHLSQNFHTLIPTLGMFGFASLRLMPSANGISTNLITIRFNRHAVSLLYADLIEFKNTKKIEEKISPKLKIDDHFRDITF